MEKDEKNFELTRVIEWFKMVLSVLAAIILALVYISFPPTEIGPNLQNLIWTCIPNAIVFLIAFPVGYLVFYKRGLTADQRILRLLISIQQDLESIREGSTVFSEQRMQEWVDKLYQHISQMIQREALRNVDLVRRAINQLPFNYRVVLILSEYGNLDYNKIGRLLGLSWEQVRNIKAEAMRRIWG